LALNYLKGCGARNPLGLVDLYRSQRRRSKLLPDLSALVVASEYVRQVFVEHGVRAQDVHVIPPPAERAADPSPPERRELGNHVLFLGRLASGKGGAHAVEAVAGAQRDLGRALRLTVAGEGPELEHCRQLAAQLDVTSEFTGWVGGERRQALLRGADVLIVPSLWPEPFGIVGLEAGGVGLPAAAYNVGGIGEWLRAGVTGELADGPGFDPLTLGSALARVLRDGSHYARLRLGAWQMSQEFSGERHLARLEVLFRAIASSGDR
jgi:glycosyltransferase involved in cell wall biosynthesis